MDVRGARDANWGEPYRDLDSETKSDFAFAPNLFQLRLMPTVLRNGPYRFFFYAGDRHEPPHVHVERDQNKAKFWIEPVTYQSSNGFKRSELLVIYRLISEHQALLLQRWHEYFGE
jgi:hypothetical protein